MSDPRTRDDSDLHNTEPEKYCRAPRCKSTNWQGYDRLHYRDGSCPPYSPHPEPNEMAEFWEFVRRVFR